MGRHRNTGVIDFLSDIADDIKDFVDDQVLDRARDAERNLRRAGRRFTEDRDGDRHGRRTSERAASRAGSASRDGRVDELREAVLALSRKVNALAESESESEDARAQAVEASPSSRPDLPIAGYDELTAAQIVGRLASLSQAELARVEAHEQANANRSTVTDRVASLRGAQPWDGYDEQTVIEIRKALAGADESLLGEVRGYETRHKNRQGVLDAVQVPASA